MRKEELDYCQQINRYNGLFFLVGRVCCAHVNMICDPQVAPRPLAVLQRDSSNHLNSHTLHGRKQSIHTRVANVLTDAQAFPFQPLEAVSFTRSNLGTPLSQLAQEHTEKEIRASVYLFFSSPRRVVVAFSFGRQSLSLPVTRAKGETNRTTNQGESWNLSWELIESPGTFVNPARQLCAFLQVDQHTSAQAREIFFRCHLVCAAREPFLRGNPPGK